MINRTHPSQLYPLCKRNILKSSTRRLCPPSLKSNFKTMQVLTFKYLLQQESDKAIKGRYSSDFYLTFENKSLFRLYFNGKAQN
ncbi:hypothetical protein D3C78_1419630 [compost metagenome]